MDPDLLRLYNDELAHLREVGVEFATEFPKIASRLSLTGVEVADPYVERLLEGFAFMAARVQLKIESEHPRLVQHLLETVYPGFLAPIPSMLIARMVPDLLDPNLARGFVLPRGSPVHARTPRGQNTCCEFRTAHDVTLWPVEIESVKYFTHAPDLPLTHLPPARQVRGGLRIRLRTTGGVRFDQLPIGSLAFHLAASDEISFRLHELILGAGLGTWVGGVSLEARTSVAAYADARSVQPLGFDDRQALLPETLRGFAGHRLLQEYAAMPQRFLFFEVAELATRLRRVAAPESEIVLLFARADPTLEPVVHAASLALFCTPAINLFSKRLDRIKLAASATEHHVLPDRTRPLDFEVHSLESVTGFGIGPVAEQRFLPLYATFHEEALNHAAYYTLRREPRLPSLEHRQRQEGPRSAYVGQEAYIALVGPGHAPYGAEMRELSLSALVTNRDLPTLLPPAPGEWTLDAAGPKVSIEVLRAPTRPQQRHARGDHGWALVSLLTLNYLSIGGEDSHRAAAALRTLLGLFGSAQDPTWARQLEGLQALEARSVVRRLPFPGPLTFGCGVEISLLIDEMSFQGASAYLLGSVLERFFARHASANSFTETLLSSTTRGPIANWSPRVGTRAEF